MSRSRRPADVMVKSRKTCKFQAKVQGQEGLQMSRSRSDKVREELTIRDASNIKKGRETKIIQKSYELKAK